MPLRQSLTPNGESGKPGSSATSSRSRSASAASSISSSQGAKKQRSTQQNIILLSSSPTALISMWNVKRFLEEGIFERTSEARARQVEMGNRKMEDIIVLYRTVKGSDGEGKPVKYYVIDNIDVLNKFAGTSGQDPW